MRIGIDISVLQTPHRMRGIGFTLINFINHLPKDAKEKFSFVFYHYPLEKDDELNQLIDLTDVKYELVEINQRNDFNLGLPGKLNLIRRLIGKGLTYKELRFGDARLKNLDNIDHFLQFDPNQPVPSRLKVKSTLIIYDLIPYILEPYYMWSYHTARDKGLSRKRSLLYHFGRRRFISKNKLICKRAENLIAISQHTKNDYVRYIKVRPDKIKVCHLGVSPLEQSSKTPASFTRYVHTSWGAISKTIESIPKPYILFVGGADPRRKLTDLAAAFNNLRAQGVEVSLVLAGDTMLGPSKVPSVELQNYLIDNPSYLEDIYFLGFVNEEQKSWLYKNALAFVYPSIYEGFGLPILEAMQYGTPVITYSNSSIDEIAGDAALYAEDYHGIIENVNNLLDNDSLRLKHKKLGQEQAVKYLWPTMVNCVLKNLKG